MLTWIILGIFIALTVGVIHAIRLDRLNKVNVQKMTLFDLSDAIDQRDWHEGIENDLWLIESRGREYDLNKYAGLVLELIGDGGKYRLSCYSKENQQDSWEFNTNEGSETHTFHFQNISRERYYARFRIQLLEPGRSDIELVKLIAIR